MQCTCLMHHGVKLQNITNYKKTSFKWVTMPVKSKNSQEYASQKILTAKINCRYTELLNNCSRLTVNLSCKFFGE